MLEVNGQVDSDQCNNKAIFIPASYQMLHLDTSQSLDTSAVAMDTRADGCVDILTTGSDVEANNDNVAVTFQVSNIESKVGL